MIFTSDLHFFHKNICKFTDRHKFTNPDNHTEWLINLWNSQVQPGQEVYHLGDFFFSSKYDQVAEVINQLNGRITCIKGNHCDTRLMRKLEENLLISAFHEYKEIKIAHHSVVLFHFPVMAWNKQGHGSLHLHGHCHGNLKDSKGRMLDVGLDNAYNLYGEHKFFTSEDIMEYMQNRSVYTPDHHKER